LVFGSFGGKRREGRGSRGRRGGLERRTTMAKLNRIVVNRDGYFVGEKIFISRLRFIGSFFSHVT